MLGKLVKDRISGFSGIVTGRSEYLWGCVQYCVTPKVDKEGLRRDSEWFDEQRLELVGQEALSVPVLPHGGPSHRGESPKAV